MTTRLVRCSALLAAMFLAGTLSAEALPIAPAGEGIAPVQTVQYNPGHYGRHQYRRSLRRYRGHPGARFELRQNRQRYCRHNPDRC